ncbi:MAG: holo-ACP synthase [Sulfurimonas sp.]|nr:holo-ACP synthase [Sulfurimonas sp.]MDD3835466.1 holo-ACP synthase [Sulfurimonas sp.]
MIGIDLIKTSRMQKLIEKFGQKALERFLSPSEIELASNYKTAAGFWAAKEALSKALGVGIGGDCSFKDISISKTPRGAPVLELSQKLITAFHITDTSLSITHDGEYAIAVVAVESTSAHKVQKL